MPKPGHRVSKLEERQSAILKKDKNNKNSKITACPTYSAPQAPSLYYIPTEGFSVAATPLSNPLPPQASQLLPTILVLKGGWERILTLTEWQNHKGMQRPMRI